MNISPEILNELKQASPLLAGMEKINVFRVPAGYFDELHLRLTDYALLNNISFSGNTEIRKTQQVPEGYFNTLSDVILAKIKVAYADTAEEESEVLSPTLSGLKNIQVFTVPQNYFETLSDNVVEKVYAENEMLSPLLLSLKDKNVLTVPQNYFETLSDNVVEKVHAENEMLSPLLLSLKDKNVFTVPQNYFETLSDNVVEKVHAEDEMLSPVLLSLKDKNVFTVPVSYFETFSNTVLNKVRKPAKIISINRNRSWLRYAAAAVVTGFIAITSLQIFNNSNRSSASLPQYIQESFQYKTENDLNAGIAKLSDDDIAKYLEKNGNVLDNALLTTNTDVSEMPSQTDYLNDENTLNEYLDKIDASGNNNSKP